MQQPTIHILLATYNGALFIAEQLESIAGQTHTAWTLTVSDDGSTDDTLSIVARFKERVSQPVTILQGPRFGSSTRNFFYLIQHAPVDDPHDLYAFCDQDDVWLDDKLMRAAQWHSQNHQKPARLHCGRTLFVDTQLKVIGLSPGIERAASFGNALVQNIASGNSMVMSHAVWMAQKMIKPEHSVWHDWTTYIVTTAMGGLVYFDNEPCLLYRQHTRNVIGANNGWPAQIKRLRPLFSGRFRLWTDANLAAVRDLGALPCPNAASLHYQFVTIRATPCPWDRLITWKNTSIRRQSMLSNLTLAVGLLLSLI
jgi:glycosyltransferase involved in cell wall biosynthesis